MNSLKNKLKEHEEKEQELELKINDLQAEKLDLLYEKENFDLQMSRL